MLPYSGKEEPILPAPMTPHPPSPSRGLRYGTAPTWGGRPHFVNAIVSVLQVGVTLMLYPVSKLETVCPRALSIPVVGLGLGLDWKELKVMAFVFLAWHLFPHWSRKEDGQRGEGI